MRQATQRLALFSRSSACLLPSRCPLLLSLRRELNAALNKRGQGRRRARDTTGGFGRDSTAPPPPPPSSYDTRAARTGKSAVQERFDQWVHDSITLYCPVGVQSVPVTTLYTLLRRHVPGFTIDTHCDGVPLQVLCAQCCYLEAHGGHLHFMRLIRPASHRHRAPQPTPSMGDDTTARTVHEYRAVAGTPAAQRRRGAEEASSLRVAAAASARCVLDADVLGFGMAGGFSRRDPRAATVLPATTPTTIRPEEVLPKLSEVRDGGCPPDSNMHAAAMCGAAQALSATLKAAAAHEATRQREPSPPPTAATELNPKPREALASEAPSSGLDDYAPAAWEGTPPPAVGDPLVSWPPAPLHPAVPAPSDTPLGENRKRPTDTTTTRRFEPSTPSVIDNLRGETPARRSPFEITEVASYSTGGDVDLTAALLLDQDESPAEQEQCMYEARGGSASLGVGATGLLGAETPVEAEEAETASQAAAAAYMRNDWFQREGRPEAGTVSATKPGLRSRGWGEASGQSDSPYRGGGLHDYGIGDEDEEDGEWVDDDDDDGPSRQSSDDGTTTADGGDEDGPDDEEADFYFADPEAALLDGRAVTVGLAKYEYRQAAPSDGVRQGPTPWAVPFKDAYDSRQLREERREQRRRGGSRGKT